MPEHPGLWVVRGAFAVQSAVLRGVQWLLYSTYSSPQKILVFRTGSIGDTICAFPALTTIRERFAKSTVHILTTAGKRSPVSMERLLDASCYDRLIDYEDHSPQQLFQLVKNEKYDLIIELPQNMATIWPMIRNMFFFRLAGIPAGLGWQLATVGWFRQLQERHLNFPSERDRLLTILSDNGIRALDTYRYPLRITTDDAETVTKIMRIRGIEGVCKSRLIALVPGAKRPQNQYPLNRFAELSQWLAKQGYTVVVLGGPEDVDRGTHLEVASQAFSFAGKLSPIQSAILFSRCRLTISNDTGPMHLSYAAGTPVLAIFSSRDFPNKWFPPQGSLVLRNNDIQCSLCLSETCPDNICMKGIPLDKVKDAFAELEKWTA